MALVVFARGGTLRVSRRAFLSCVVIGCLLPGANSILFFAERNVPTGLASLIIASPSTGLAALRIDPRATAGGRVLAGRIGFAGSASWHSRPEVRSGGVALCFCSAVMSATGSFSRARGSRSPRTVAATSLEMLAGGSRCCRWAHSPCTLVLAVRRLDRRLDDLVCFGRWLADTAYVWLLANASLGMVSTYAYVNPIVAISLGVLFRGEHLDVAAAGRRGDRGHRRRDGRAQGAATAPPPDEGVRCEELDESRLAA